MSVSRKKQLKVSESASIDVQIQKNAPMKIHLLINNQTVLQKYGQPFCCKNLGDACTVTQIYLELQ